MQRSPPLHLVLIRALWDADAGVWVATSEDIPGLATEAETLEDLRDKVVAMIPELFEANGITLDVAEIPVHFLAEQTTRVAIPQPAH